MLAVCRLRPLRSRAWLLVIAVALAACGDAKPFNDRVFAGSNDDDLTAGSGGMGEPDDDGGVGEAGSDAGGSDESGCFSVIASDKLPARSNVMSRRPAVGGSTSVFTSDLFGLFASSCGGCHIDNQLGGLHVSRTNFSTVITQQALDKITSDDPAMFMPPYGAGGKPFSERKSTDPIVELAGLLEAWIAAGRPNDAFDIANDSGGSDPARYLLSEEIGLNLTNLGHCIPTASIVGTETQKTQELDEMFAAATELPAKLEDTDLFTLDTEVLAHHRVIDFAPAYTLWADNAKKIRAVRVPMGKSIAFDAATQRFAIPPNTRFYKTFLKQVVDLKGRDSYRKIETRLIVARPDETLPDGTVRSTALFGTYAWNEDETEAELVQDPLRNGEPFRDRLLTIITDEKAADAVIETGPDNLQDALQDAGLTRHYAIPGSERCIQCHMGAPDESFVLGFLPLQILRRPLGEGGVIEPAERDELNQLERLIDYGIITGIDSVNQIKLLEDSGGERKPRNDRELTAQGYMVGNCAHCHNPRGYPSTIAPELRDLLDFMPGKDSGIFQFPLERTSPRIFRGESASKAIPYITPSEYDALGASGQYENKYVQNPEDDLNIGPSQFILAPWRSLIYRNVDTPFSYDEDFTLFPRMPMNTPGYDCRARTIMGAWMLSIPAKLKEEGRPRFVTGQHFFYPEVGHEAAQPYEEVLPSDSSYDYERRKGERRAAAFETGLRVSDCPDPVAVDIVDPHVARGETLTPYPLVVTFPDPTPNPGVEEPELLSYTLRMPEGPHWSVTDLTEPPGDWNPRRSDWEDVLVERSFDPVMTPPRLQSTLHTLHEIHLTPDFAQWALDPVPFGLWEAKETCDFSDVPKVSDFTGDARPRWIDKETPSESAPVYSVSRGAQVFGLICLHCHGPQADSKGRLAATVADITGGQTRVANLRDGIFGPTDMPGANRERVFGAAATMTTSSEDWAARYLLFMGMGGTQRTIPRVALDAIKTSTVLGKKRPEPSALSVPDANMLGVVQALCGSLLPARKSNFVFEDGRLDFRETATHKTALIDANYDAQLWEDLCTLDNPLKSVRVVQPFDRYLEDPTKEIAYYEIENLIAGGLRDRDRYPSNTPIGDHTGHVQASLDASNQGPWCYLRPAHEVTRAKLEGEWSEHSPGTAPPYCPESFLSDETNYFDAEDADLWTARGAMNAGLSVFVYLRALAQGDVQPAIPYNRCEQRP